MAVSQRLADACDSATHLRVGVKDAGNATSLLSQRGPVDANVTCGDLGVNAYAKGADRGGERIVRGSDGPAFCTSDHYRSFTQFSLSARAPG